MEEDAMIGTAKLRRKIVMSEKMKKTEIKKNGSPRNPLRDVNVLPIPPCHASIDAQRKGCFRFLRPNSSSKEHVIPRSKSQPRTPKSAPPNSKTLSFRTLTDPPSFPQKPLPKPISENPQNLRSKKQAKVTAPALLNEWNQLKPNPRYFKEGNGSCATRTPEKIVVIEEIKASDFEVKENKQLSKTPRSNSTPPIHSSISPEIPCGFSLAPTPVCFATGHVMAGIKDRRKCRPRGILTIGEEQRDVSRVSSDPPPCAEASVCWFSSSLEIVNGSGSGGSSSKVQNFDFPNEASVNWLLSQNGAVENVSEHGSEVPNSSILDAKLGEETTPSFCTGVLRTPTSGSSISPFSVIVQRAEASSRLRVLTSQREKGGYRYGNALEFSPITPTSWSNSDMVSTPCSYTNSRKNGLIAPLELDSTIEDLEAIRLSTRMILGNCQNDVSPFNSLGFKFGSQPTTLNSTDLNCFKISRCNKLSKVETNKKLSSPDVRISWREGLLSRIFDVRELDSYQSYIDDEHADYQKDCNGSACESRSSTFDKENGFGSYEFPVDENKIGVQMCQSNVSHLQLNSMAESISTEGGLVSSGDSDWTLFYKNNLFEV